MSDEAGIVVLIGRLFVAVFPAYVSGLGFHVRNPKAAEGYAQSVNFPIVSLTGLPAGVFLIVASASIALGIWPDIGALMLGAFVIPAAWYFHRFWMLDDAGQRAMQQQLFFRNVTTLGACLIMFGFFASVGDGLRFAITSPLIDLR